MNLADLFSVTSLTAAVNKLPYAQSPMRDLGIVQEKGIRTTTITVEEAAGRLYLIANTSRNGEGSVARRNRRTRRTFELFHLVESGVVLPQDIQDIAPFGEDVSGRPLDAQAQAINDLLMTLRNSIEITREWQRIGAARGKILDADGSVVYDLYSEFGVAAQTVDIALGTAGTDVRARVMAAKRAAETKLTGAAVTGFVGLADPAFMDALTGHANVKVAYANWQAAQDRLAGDVRRGFRFGDVDWIEVNTTVSGQAFIPANKARLIPRGAGIFQMYNGPANYNETVNTMGLAYYSKAEPRKMGKGWDLEVQANPLAICLYPEALVEITMS